MPSIVFRRAVLLAVTGMMALSACATSTTETTWQEPPEFNAAMWNVVRPTSDSGGTLRVVTLRECDHLAPASATGGTCRNIQRLLTRQLMAFSDAPGREGSVTVPDLALAGGVPDATRTVWRYDVRNDVRWSDGLPLTAEEVAAGVRALGNRIPGVDVQAVTVDSSDARASTQITITLASAVGDLDSVMTLPQAAPVHAGGVAWTGPFVVGSTNPTVLDRNPQWSAQTDPIRRPLVDRIELGVVPDATAAYALVRDGAADVLIDPTLEPGMAQAVLDFPAIGNMADNPGTGRVTMLALPGYGHAAWQNEDCRRSVFSAIDRQAVVDVLAQEITVREFAGAAATTLSAPTIASYDWSFEPFAVGQERTGDVDAARTLAEQCGPATDRRAVLAVPDTPKAAAIADAVRTSVARADITVDVVRIPLTEWVATSTSPRALREAGIDWVLMQRIAAIPGVWGYWYPLVAGDLVGREPSTNVAQVEIPAVDVLLGSDEIASKDRLMLDSVGRTIDRLVLSSVRYIPLAIDKALLLRPATVANVTTNAGLGNEYDLVNVGVR